MLKLRTTDARLVRAAKRGSKDAAGWLFDAYWDDAVVTALRILGSTSAAEDAAADAFEAAFAKIADLRGTEFGPWLRRIVINRALNELRRERRSVPVGGSEPSSWVDGDFETAHPEIVAAVRALPEERRQAVFLRYWLDLSPDEIAEITDVPVGTVNSRLARALAELRRDHEVQQ